MKFELSIDQYNKFAEWVNSHKPAYTGAIGGRYTFTFHDTSLGRITKVIDEVTNKVLDLTNYDEW